MQRIYLSKKGKNQIFRVFQNTYWNLRLRGNYYMNSQCCLSANPSGINCKPTSLYEYHKYFRSVKTVDRCKPTSQWERFLLHAAPAVCFWQTWLNWQSVRYIYHKLHNNNHNFSAFPCSRVRVSKKQFMGCITLIKVLNINI